MEKANAPKSDFEDSFNNTSTEAALQAVLQKINNAVYYNILIPKNAEEPFAINVLPTDAPHESATDMYFVDRYNAQLIWLQKFSDKNTGQKIRATFKPIHIASIYGLPSKILGLIVCLLGTFFLQVII